MWPCDDLERVRDLEELPLTQAAREVLSDASQMCLRCEPKSPCSLFCEHGEGRTSIIIIDLTADQTLRDQSIDEPGDAARGEHHAIRNIRHPQGTSRRSSETQEDVVLRERHVMFIPQLFVQIPDQVVMRVKKRLPSSQFGIRQTVGRHSRGAYLRGPPGQDCQMQC
jgi:hypothetical protein